MEQRQSEIKKSLGDRKLISWYDYTCVDALISHQSKKNTCFIRIHFTAQSYGVCECDYIYI